MSNKESALMALENRMVPKRISGPKGEQQEGGNNHVVRTFIVHNMLLAL
jgi:hypothetical protein